MRLIQISRPGTFDDTFVTNGYFTNQAKTLASRNKVELWDRKLLVKNFLKIKEDEGTKAKRKSGGDQP
jgi:hypothetical protein